MRQTFYWDEILQWLPFYLLRQHLYSTLCIFLTNTVFSLNSKKRHLRNAVGSLKPFNQVLKFCKNLAEMI